MPPGKRNTRGGKGRGQSRKKRNEDIFPLITDEVLSAFPEPVLLYAGDGSILFVNHAAAESLGFDPAGISMDELKDRIALPERDGSGNGARDLLLSDLPCEGDAEPAFCRFRGAGGKTRMAIASSAPVVYSGSTIGTVVTWHDITELTERGESVILNRAALEGLLVERTDGLIKSREVIARQKRLSEIGTLAATIAHELRNPLGVIRTAAYNIRRKSEDPRLDRHLANIDRKIEESAAIINNILNYSKVNDPVMRPVNLAELLVDCIDSTRKKYLSLIHI